MQNLMIYIDVSFIIYMYISTVAIDSVGVQVFIS